MHPALKSVILLFAICLICISTAVAPIYAGNKNNDKVNILLFYSWHKDMPWQKAIEKGLKEKLAQKKIPVVFYEEYIDGGRFSKPRIVDGLEHFLKVKYADVRIDMMVSEGFPAKAMMEKMEDLFPYAQKLSVQSRREGAGNDPNDLWKISVHRYYSRAVRAVVDVYDPERIFVTGDFFTAQGKKRRTEFQYGIKEAGVDIPVTYSAEPTLDAVIEKIAGLPPKTAVFYLLFYNDGKGRRITPYQAAQRIVAAANAPVFSHWDSLMGSGIVGGYMLSGEKAGKQIADAVSFFIKERNGGALSLETDGNEMFEYQYDWRQMQRWRINRDNLPENSRILFYTPGIFEAYRLEMTVILSFITILVVLLFILGFETRRRRNIAARLSDNQERLDAILKANPDPIVVFDAGGSVQYLNPVFENVIGCSKAKMNGRRFPFLSDASQKNIKEMIRREDLQKGPLSIEVNGTSNSGDTIDMIAGAAVIQGSEGDLAGIVINFTDVGKQKKLERQLHQARKMEAVGRLAGGVAHDFNNMLSIITGISEILMEDIGAESPYFDNLKEIFKAAERSAVLTRQLLAFARKQTIAPVPLDLNDTVEGMLKMLKRLIGENIELTWLPKKNIWTVKLDPSQVDQILVNLIVNARDSINNVGKITIETDNIFVDEVYCQNFTDVIPGDYIMIAIGDTGCGMDRATVANIFEPFFTTKGLGEGTGLGLATVYGIIKQNNGFINVYSEPGRGTTFKIYLPRYEAEEKKSLKQKQVEKGVMGFETIMVVEDEASILRMTATMLERSGYTVITADNPVEALSIGESYYGEIDMLITDVVMPEMSGKELSTKLSRLYPDIKCLYMSGYTANMIARHGVLDEGIQFINKPFTKRDLSVKVRHVLDET